MRTMLRTFATLFLIVFGIAVVANIASGPPSGKVPPSAAECADPAACEEANRIAYGNVAKNEAAKKKREREWAVSVVALRALRASMHDPASFQIERVLQMSDGSLCVDYRARNAFNALRMGQAVIAPKASATTGDARFVELWNRHCGGRNGDDITHIRSAM
jgi:hypothetical protein